MTDLIQSAFKSFDTAKQTLLHVMEREYPINARVQVKTDKLDYFGFVSGHTPERCCIKITNEKTNKISSANYSSVLLMGDVK